MKNRSYIEMYKPSRNDIIMISLTVVVILLFRILYIDIFQSLMERYGFQLSTVFQSFIDNVIVLLLSIILDVVGAWQLSKIRPYGQNTLKRFFYDLTLLIFVSAFGAIILGRSEMTEMSNNNVWWQFLLFSFLSVFLFNAFLVGLLDFVFYTLQVRETMLQERLSKRQAEFQYHKLKEQVNPHFLFNSLNMLDYLVQSGENDRASIYIQKLARIYRYILQNCDEELVTIEDELSLAEHYIDLMKVRFSEGIEYEVNVPEEYHSKMVVPFSLQMLVENAIKHNVVSSKDPLLIQISVVDNKLLVTNNIQLRLNVNESMNVGLNNICGQYKDVTGQEVLIQMTEDEFVVKLPII